MNKYFKTLFFILCFALLSTHIFAEKSLVTLHSLDGRSITVDEKYVSDYNNVGWYSSFAMLYSLDGRTIVVGDTQVEAHKSVGWYEEPVMTVFSIDGRSTVIPVGELDDYNSVGWFSSFVTLYSLDGRTIVVGDTQVDEYKAAYWYETPVTTVYALDGRSLVIPSADLEAFQNVGWYTRKDYIDSTSRQFALDFNCVLQNPELPTGCEVTALTSVLNYYGFDIQKTSLANTYLDMGPIGSTSPYTAFVGNPATSNSFGCYAPVIKNCAEKYLSAQNSSLKVHDTTGTNLESLLVEVVNGSPVIIWATISMVPSYKSVSWNIDGATVSWLANEHCMVLYGYDKTRNVVKIADPLKGNVEYSASLFERRFKELQMQSVIIKY